MAARNLPSHGEPLIIEEILQLLSSDSASIDGKSARIVGRLEEHNIHTCTAQVVDSNNRQPLTIDTRLVEPFNAKIGSLFQFIGELECSSNSVTLKARVVRCVDGLDMKMYQKALIAQRQYLSSRKEDYS
ncbi:CST complex subunit TEN1-like [Haliotis rubra]|uniref:CST complex subunit TEN1-like n=1 Tax=Haliotis rubra TaxID=36100 RepID=UPI001EE59EF9|nr:CST complex subunit TEN1-like [Haliotis rubra]